MSMVSNFLQIQRDELDAIRSCYGDRVNIEDIDTNIKGHIIIELEALSQCSMVHVTVKGGMFNTEEKKTDLFSVLSPVKLLFTLTTGYPSVVPNLELECEWMSHNLMSSILKKLAEVCSENLLMPSLNLCCTTVINEIKQKEEELFEICLDDTPFAKKYKLSGSTVLQQMTKSVESLINEKFEKQYFDCEVCLENKVGRECIRFTPCDHVFCHNCVSTFFLKRIYTIGICSFGCLSSGCMTIASDKIIWRAIGEAEYCRYKDLRLQQCLTFMNKRIICPRRLCQNPDINLDDEAHGIGLCHLCGYSFCRYCSKDCHGIEAHRFNEADRVRIIEEWESGTERDKLIMSQRFGGIKQLKSLIEIIRNEDRVKTNITECPFCCVKIEKNDGCNTVYCTKCDSTICWICDDSVSSYEMEYHFSVDGKPSCFYRLMEHSYIYR